MSQRAKPTSSSSRAAPADASAAPKAARIGSAMTSSGLSQRIASPRSLEEAEARYVESRNAWTAAMRAAASGKPADLASLAIAQEAYEAATVERDRWASGARVAVPVQTDGERAAIDIVVDQELAWRVVHRQPAPRRGLLGRMFGRKPKD